MEQQTIELNQYIDSGVHVLTTAQKRQARERLEELSQTGLGIERLPAENLGQALAGSLYPRISPEFLRLNQDYKDPKTDETYRVPQFGVYSLENPLMEIRMGRNISGEYLFEIESPLKIPFVLQEDLFFATDFGTDPNPELWDHHKGGFSTRYTGIFCPKNKRLSKKLRRRYKNGLQLSSTFYGFIPTETKEAITEAEHIFKKNIFLAAQTAPEDWTLRSQPKPRIVADPLIIGVLGRKCYLVDHFNTTPVENYARLEFTV